MPQSSRQAMTPSAYVAAVRRRWWLVLGVTVAALAVGFLVTRFEGQSNRAEAESTPVTYVATTILISNPTVSTNLGTLAALATIGQVPEDVAAGIEGYDAQDVVESTSVVVGTEAPSTPGSGGESQQQSSADRAGRTSTDSELLTIQARAEDEATALALADGLARELIDYDIAQRESALEESLAEVTEKIEELRPILLEEEAVLQPEETEERQGGGTGGTSRSVASTEYEVRLDEYTALLAEKQRIEDSPTTEPGLTVLAPAAATIVGDAREEATLVPSGPRVRMAIAGVLGLIGGLGLALALGSADRTLRSADAVERHMGHRVVGMIRRIRRRDHGAPVAGGQAGESFRILAARLARHAREHRERTSEGLAVLVVSPSADDGRTTLTRNLAGGLAELGTDVLVLSCDLRDPGSGSLFVDVDITDPALGGLAAALRGTNGERVVASDQELVVSPGLRFIPPGVRDDSEPVVLLGSDRMRRALTELRPSTGVLLIDTPPLLTVSDAAPLVELVDLVLVVVREGRTTEDDAARMRDMLDGLGAVAVGVVVNGATSMTPPHRSDTGHLGVPLGGGLSPLVRHDLST